MILKFCTQRIFGKKKAFLVILDFAKSFRHLRLAKINVMSVTIARGCVMRDCPLAIEKVLRR
jgi:hypothetical protein